MKLIDKHKKLIEELIKKYQLQEIENFIIKNSWSCINISIKNSETEEINYNEKIGISKFGGLPHFPKDMEWPINKNKEFITVTEYGERNETFSKLCSNQNLFVDVKL